MNSDISMELELLREKLYIAIEWTDLIYEKERRYETKYISDVLNDFTEEGISTEDAVPIIISSIEKICEKKINHRYDPRITALYAYKGVFEYDNFHIFRYFLNNIHVLHCMRAVKYVITISEDDADRWHDIITEEILKSISECKFDLFRELIGYHEDEVYDRNKSIEDSFINKRYKAISQYLLKHHNISTIIFDYNRISRRSASNILIVNRLFIRDMFNYAKETVELLVELKYTLITYEDILRNKMQLRADLNLYKQDYYDVYTDDTGKLYAIYNHNYDAILNSPQRDELINYFTNEAHVSVLIYVRNNYNNIYIKPRPKIVASLFLLDTISDDRIKDMMLYMIHNEHYYMCNKLMIECKNNFSDKRIKKFNNEVSDELISTLTSIMQTKGPAYNAPSLCDSFERLVCDLINMRNINLLYLINLRANNDDLLYSSIRYRSIHLLRCLLMLYGVDRIELNDDRISNDIFPHLSKEDILFINELFRYYGRNYLF